ncbi:hypothetical protein [Stutzerimonas degradans]|uniref:Uncharacterized protein n=1 Tax=Stutzerimonas degradans TaxID=2968968 RepID=A0A8E2U1M9_9GAMM|nr:hypothetical protein [Stutzerimonas degradans]MCQ4276304.1 hypothetical protein [Stutzerimonas degradans]PNF76945.1 hypothetical protein CXK95_10505 [Stutzerimonas degradans]QPT22407.1 hypothetical protein I6G33_03760 [Stutzerimonas degradans]
MMTPAFTLTLMLFGWFLVALALLWGMMRIARRHPRSRVLHRDHPSTKIFSLPLPFRKIF